MLGFLLFSALCLLIGAGNFLRLAFPVGGLAVGAFLFWRCPPHYVSFTWWLWFLTPFVRRLIDYKAGWIDPSPTLLTPYLVTLISCASLIRYVYDPLRREAVPFVLAGAGVLYGFGIGVMQNPVTDVARALLDWSAPIIFGFHLFINWRDYDRYRRIIGRTFTWGVLLMGCYGVAQFLVAPEWDRFWLESISQTQDIPSFGNPRPFELRVWGTLNAPGPFAVVMMAGLLLLFAGRGGSRLPVATVGHLSFLLSQVRAAWFGWSVGLLVLIVARPPRARRRLGLTILVLLICVAPLTTIEPFSEVISSRFGSSIALRDDESYNARSEAYGRLIGEAVLQPVGKGLGSMAALNHPLVGNRDNAFIDLLFSLGWPGNLLYVGGLLLILIGLLQNHNCPSDSFADASRAIAFATFAQFIFGSVMLSVSGMILWGFSAMALAARLYHTQKLNDALRVGVFDAPLVRRPPPSERRG